MLSPKEKASIILILKIVEEYKDDCCPDDRRDKVNLLCKYGDTNGINKEDLMEICMIVGYCLGNHDGYMEATNDNSVSFSAN